MSADGLLHAHHGAYAAIDVLLRGRQTHAVHVNAAVGAQPAVCTRGSRQTGASRCRSADAGEPLGRPGIARTCAGDVGVAVKARVVVTQRAQAAFSTSEHASAPKPALRAASRGAVPPSVPYADKRPAL